MSDYARIIATRIKNGSMTLDDAELSVDTQTFYSVKKLLKKTLDVQSNIVAIEEVPEGLQTIKEAAKILNLKPSRVSAYIHANKNFIPDFVVYVEGRGAFGKKLLIKKEGIIALSTIDWPSRKSRSPYKNDSISLVREVPDSLSTRTKNIIQKMEKIKSDLEALDRLEKLDSALTNIYA